MLWNASGITGYAIAASDGPLGTVSDLLFDDTSWLVRWLVVDTGNWLAGRKVLLPTFVLGHLDPEARQFAVKLTMQQVKDSPDIDTHQPVSRQMEASVFDYYGWSPYLGTGYLMGGVGGFAGGAMASTPALELSWQGAERRMLHLNNNDPHLRSVDAVSGYDIHARDGEIGHVKDFLLQDSDWSLHFIVVDTKNWWPGKTVLIAPKSVRKIDWATNKVNLTVGRAKVKNSPAYDASMTIDRTYERHLHSYYGDSLGLS